MSKRRKVVIAVAVIISFALLGLTVWLTTRSTGKEDGGETPKAKQEVRRQDAGEYSRTTTTPAGWQRSEIEDGSVSVAFPSGWTATSAGATGIFERSIVVAFAGNEEQPATSVTIGVNQKSLDDTVAEYKTYISETYPGVFELIGEKSLTIDGRNAIELRYDESPGESEGSEEIVTRHYFVQVDELTYALPEVYEYDEEGLPMSAENSLIFFESLRFN